MTSFGKGLVEAARQAQAIARGELDPATYRVRVPADIDVKAIRKATKLTQAAFAARFGFPIGALRDLEQGRARPDASTRAYLLVIRREPEAVQRALDRLMTGRTVIAIAHRLSTLSNFDRILVMQSGQVLQDGAPRTIENTPGPYRDLIRRQAFHVVMNEAAEPGEARAA